ncbi:Helix-loop-helix DNA-binding domain protein [Necator americanus]|uniref:Helix-loop-helix DNA-binding domain protein n=1 Tax=Necator americanus TaxID=51031 RepID=W2SR70_NECAM|nr:Helix-loop-helix DNA-binding domain protein [Necator americanus]ETN71336.1 Helix-loop-helix DNA-binding domain protein [Necator americanus]
MLTTSSNMFNCNDIPMSDPFLSLETNLEDISDVIRMDTEDVLAMDATWGGGHQQPHASHYPYAKPFVRPNQHSPPQDYYDSNRSREIGSIVSLLQADSPPSSDPYAAMKFSPPNFDTNVNLNGPAGMLPKLGASVVQPLQINHYQSGDQRLFALENDKELGSRAGLWFPSAETVFPGLQAQQLTAPAMQPFSQVLSPPAMFIDTKPPFVQNSPEQNYMVSPGGGYSSCTSVAATANVKVESPVSIQMTRSHSDGNTADMLSPQQNSSNGATTKEELLRLLVNMSPGQVERLKGSAGRRSSSHSRPSGVATRVPRDDSWPQDDDSDDEDEVTSEEPRRKGPKTERRTAHNLIEKKYRCSINDRIQHLKAILAGDDAKLSKSATLRKAIEHIGKLEAENRDLRQEVQRLSSILHNNNIEVLPPSVPVVGSPALSPSTSSASMQSPGATTSPTTSPTLPPKGAKRPRTSVEQGRVTIFAIMFAMLMWNPLNLLATGSSVSARSNHDNVAPTGGRVLSENTDAFDNYLTADEWWQTRVIKPCFVWSVNIFVVVCVLTRLLVYGEPVQDFKSRSWRVFLSTQARARHEAEHGNVREAQRQYIECLQILERPLPSAGVEQALSVVWQIIRHALNSLWIGRPTFSFTPFLQNLGCKRIKFISQELYSLTENLRSHRKRGDVLSRLRAGLKLRLLTLLASELSGDNGLKEIDTVDVSRLLITISMAGGLPKKENSWDCATWLTEGDALCTWWTHVFTCALFWKQGMREKAKQHYAVVRRCPDELLNSPLALAVGHAFCSKKLCADDRDSANFGKFVLIHSRKALEQLRLAYTREAAPEVAHLQDALRRLAYEWVMSSLLDAWRQNLESGKPYWCQHITEDYRTLYQEACNHYTHIQLHGGGERGSRVGSSSL